MNFIIKNNYFYIFALIISLCIKFSLFCLDKKIKEISDKNNLNQITSIDKSSEKLQKKNLIEDTEYSEGHLPNYAYLGGFLKPWEAVPEETLIEINFENAQLINLINYFEKTYGLTFILDNIIEPLPEGGKNPIGIRFSFKTEKAFNRKQAWDVFVAFLDMAQLMVIPGPAERVYQITSNRPDSRLSTNKDPLPLFIGVDKTLIPTNDIKIRYVYFVQNASSETIKAVVEKLRSPISSAPILVGELNALILTDRASTIQTILTILNELDRSVLPETLVVLKLQKTDAVSVQKLYASLVNEEKSFLSRLNTWGKKPPSTGYFTENVRVVADQRTNSLIILGPRHNVQMLENFLKTEIDRDVDLPYSPLHVYPLKYIDASATAQIITDLKNGFQSQSPGARVGSVIGGTKFLKPTVTVTAEKTTNSLVINADFDDYLQIYELLEKIDVEQPQVAIQVLVLDVKLSEERSLGVQLRDKTYSQVGNVNFQTSGLPLGTVSDAGIVQNFNTGANGSTRLLGDLINLAGNNISGSTLLTLGSDSFGIWGLFKVLQAQFNVSVVAKPFLVTTHKYQAKISVTEIQRVITSSVVGQGTPRQSRGDLSAGLTVIITPQISPDGFVTLATSVVNSNFAPGSVGGDNRDEKSVQTSVTIADNQVLALGGLVIDRENENEYKVPILGDVPLLGWFFKSKRKSNQKSSLLVLISAKIIQTKDQQMANEFTQSRMDAANNILEKMDASNQKQDPIGRWFFNDDDPRYRCNQEKFTEQKKATFRQEKIESQKLQEVPESIRRNSRRRRSRPAQDRDTQDMYAREARTKSTWIQNKKIGEGEPPIQAITPEMTQEKKALNVLSPITANKQESMESAVETTTKKLEANSVIFPSQSAPIAEAAPVNIQTPLAGDIQRGRNKGLLEFVQDQPEGAGAS